MFVSLAAEINHHGLDTIVINEGECINFIVQHEIQTLTKYHVAENLRQTSRP